MPTRRQTNVRPTPGPATRLGLASVLAGLLVCGPALADRPSRTDPEVQAARAAALERKALNRVDTSQPSITGEVPNDTMDRVRNHLAGVTNAAPDSFEVVQAQQQEWPNGSMGCPQPEHQYTQRPTSGYWIVLDHGGRNYDYRVAASGHYILCKRIHLEKPPAH